jgi:FAD/FMN-containing dehydrogenase
MNRTGATDRMGAAAGTGAALRARMRGRVIDASDPGHGQARRVWNGAVDRYPAMIACCQDTADVVTAVGFGRAHGLPIAVRAGGHGVAGRAVCDGGLVIDLRGLSQVRIDPRRRLARAGAGALNGEFDAATQRHGLATTAGIVSHTGLAGLTLGGGIRWLMRRCGATCDNLTGVDAEPPLVHDHVPSRRRAGRYRSRGGRVQRQARRVRYQHQRGLGAARAGRRRVDQRTMGPHPRVLGRCVRQFPR